MALMSFLFIGLNVIRLKLSRDHLEKDVRDARIQIDQLQHLVMIERCISADLQRKIDLINLCRPLSRSTASTLANILSASTSERQEMLSIIKGSLDHQEREGRGGEASIVLPPPSGSGETGATHVTAIHNISKEEVSEALEGKDTDTAGNNKVVVNVELPLLGHGHNNSTKGLTHSPSAAAILLPGTPSHVVGEPPVRSSSATPGHIPEPSPLANGSSALRLVGNNMDGSSSMNHTPLSSSGSSRVGTPPVNHKYSLPLPTTSTTGPTASEKKAVPIDIPTADESTLLNGTRPKQGEHGDSKLTDAEITLDIILAHPVTVEMLKDRLISMHAPETLIFYLEVQAYKRAPQLQLKRMATDIYDTYIQASAENQVNFSSTLRDLIAKRVKEPRPNHVIFKEAEREAYRLVMQNVWPSFRDSHEFVVSAMILRGLIPPPDRPRGISIHWQAGGVSGDSSPDPSLAKSKINRSQASVDVNDDKEGKELDHEG
jgi:hypothetical protein